MKKVIVQNIFKIILKLVLKLLVKFLITKLLPDHLESSKMKISINLQIRISR